MAWQACLSQNSQEPTWPMRRFKSVWKGLKDLTGNVRPWWCNGLVRVWYWFGLSKFHFCSHFCIVYCIWSLYIVWSGTCSLVHGCLLEESGPDLVQFNLRLEGPQGRFGWCVCIGEAGMWLAAWLAWACLAVGPRPGAGPRLRFGPRLGVGPRQGNLYSCSYSCIWSLYVVCSRIIQPARSILMTFIIFGSTSCIIFVLVCSSFLLL